jgi:hypothetical protein
VPVSSAPRGPSGDLAARGVYGVVTVRGPGAGPLRYHYPGGELGVATLVRRFPEEGVFGEHACWAGRLLPHATLCRGLPAPGLEPRRHVVVSSATGQCARTGGRSSRARAERGRRSLRTLLSPVLPSARAPTAGPGWRRPQTPARLRPSTERRSCSSVNQSCSNGAQLSGAWYRISGGITRSRTRFSEMGLRCPPHLQRVPGGGLFFTGLICRQRVQRTNRRPAFWRPGLVFRGPVVLERVRRKGWWRSGRSAFIVWPAGWLGSGPGPGREPVCGARSPAGALARWVRRRGCGRR